MSYEGLREAFARAAEAAEIEAAPHEVRSTFSTWANGRGEEARVIELCLGHGERNQVDAVTTTPAGQGGADAGLGRSSGPHESGNRRDPDQPGGVRFGHAFETILLP